MGVLADGVFIAILAHGIIGLSLVWDKILLRRPATRNLVSYVFWMGAMSVFGVILAFFGWKTPALSTSLLALGAGALHIVAIFFYYLALQRGEASEALAVMGGFSPVVTALLGIPLLKQPLGGHGLLAFLLLVAGGFVMFFA